MIKSSNPYISARETDFFYYITDIMALMRRVIQELENVLRIPNPTNLDIWIQCSCTRLPIAQAQIPAGIPHIGFDLSNERLCLALSANGESYMQNIKNEAMRIADREHIYLPEINYACPYYNALQNNAPLPVAVPAAED